MYTIQDKHFGKITISTLNLPDYVLSPSGTYLPTGQVLVDYRHEEDNEKDFLRLAVVNDDGSDFTEIYAGVIPEHEKANGIRFMPYPDGRRVLLGDYVLECVPDIKHCKKASVLKVDYPWGLQADSRIFKSWSEIIISQDMKHICWTTLLTSGGASVSIGELNRREDRYVIENAVVISSGPAYLEDKYRPGYVIPQKLLGGEVKQFSRGGAAITSVGAGNGALTDSVETDLKSGQVTPLTNNYGYEETTILSPDERLGIVMSTRHSKHTNFAVLGLLPRPYAALVTMGLSLQVYQFAVAGVRRQRMGNIGPVLIDIKHSQAERNYPGVPLNDPENAWVYLSPMSWNPDGQKVMWPEMKRGEYGNKRIRIAQLHDYKPGEPAPTVPTPLDLPYAKGGEYAFEGGKVQDSFKIAGKHSGEIRFEGRPGFAEKVYDNYSDDGLSFYQGYECLQSAPTLTVYEADLDLKGPTDGEMKLRMAFQGAGYRDIPVLLFEQGEDGLPQTRGYSRYGDERIDVDIMR